MSYCRFSSDFFECDVYVYESVYDCFTIHVASSRLAKKVPDNIKNMDVSTSEKWVEQHLAISKWVRNKPDEYIALEGEYAGETFDVGTAGECADLLVEIKESGLNVPQYAIDALRDEEKSDG